MHIHLEINSENLNDCLSTMPPASVIYNQTF
jgi:hypothetical protein